MVPVPSLQEITSQQLKYSCTSCVHERALAALPSLLQRRTVSAPGKVLVAGGYLVLDRPNVGVVLAATARFFTSVKWTEEKVRVLAACRLLVNFEL